MSHIDICISILQKESFREVSSVRLSHGLKSRLAKIRARLTLKDGKERSMEELIELLADAYEEKENKEK